MLPLLIQTRVESLADLPLLSHLTELRTTVVDLKQTLCLHELKLKQLRLRRLSQSPAVVLRLLWGSTYNRPLLKLSLHRFVYILSLLKTRVIAP